VIGAEPLANIIEPGKRLTPRAAFQMLNCNREVRRPIGSANITEEWRAAIVDELMAPHERATTFEGGLAAIVPRSTMTARAL
tara:strand:- start:106 stop:351 length:246 start_codon:yes stop_codon:yes gene_type:complete